MSITRLKIWAWWPAFDLLFLGLLEVLRLPIIVPERLASCSAPAVRDLKTGLLICSLLSQWLLLLCLLIHSFGEGLIPGVCCCWRLFCLFLYYLSCTFPWCIGSLPTGHTDLTHQSRWLIEWLCCLDAWIKTYTGIIITKYSYYKP